MKRCLIVVDYQNDFIDGALGFDSAIKIKENITEKIREYRLRNDEIIFTMDTHTNNYLETEEGNNLPIIHCVKGTNGHDIQEDVSLLKSPKDKVFEKPTFPSLALGKYLEKKEYSSIELCGLVSNICVISNAIIAKSALPNAHILVDALATDSYDKNLHNKTLDVLEGLQIEVINK
ncbi:MAG: isochorismatase family cysteine hydrolase [Candidatus Izemoplasmatales bacterium]|nr:isochorismatase family cysteine hydrolase [Candidatus Izemoplasmatales bacterium]